MIKWPNDILVDARKVAGILVERRQNEDWTVLGIGVNVAVSAFPAELADRAGSLERSPAAVEQFLGSCSAPCRTSSMRRSRGARRLECPRRCCADAG